MPHIHLETTSDLPENSKVPDILEALVYELGRHESVRIDTLKAYHTLRSNWVVGEGHPPGIAHCTVSLLSGRSSQVKLEISYALGLVLRESFAESLAAGEVGLSLEIREMDAETYFKAR